MKRVVVIAFVAILIVRCTPDASPAADPVQPKRDVQQAPRDVDVSAPADVAGIPDDATKSASGLAWRIMRDGAGAKSPTAEDAVTIEFTGWTTDGRAFDSSKRRGEPMKVQVKRLVEGWSEGVQMMVEGEKRRLWIPAAIAYGHSPPSGRPAGPLVVDVELLRIDEAPKVLTGPSPPSDLREAPSRAKRTKSGLAYEVLRAGDGKHRPRASDDVTVHYAAWTSDGALFDSTYARGEPSVMAVESALAGWREGLQLMSVGERSRFWLPSALAYGDAPTRKGAPAGSLVFEMELLAITDR
jgi:FKBP-type peptidyl-prolyl cis-trans isomerase